MTQWFFYFSDDYNADLHSYIDGLFDQTELTTEERVQASDALIDAYVRHVSGANGWDDVRPPAGALERLGSLIMKADYEDKRSNKRRVVEYNTHSPRQTRRRDEYEKAVADIWYDEFSNRRGARSVVRRDDDGNQVTAKVAIFDETVPNTTKPTAW